MMHENHISKTNTHNNTSKVENIIQITINIEENKKYVKNPTSED